MSKLVTLIGSAMLAAVVVVACSGEDAETPAGTSSTTGSGGSDTTSSSTTAATSTGSNTGGASATATSSTGSSMSTFGSCLDDRPSGAPVPPAPKGYSGGSCPTIVPGVNAITSSGNARSFIFVVPTDLAPGERLPLVFLWPWLGGDAQDFLEKGEVQEAVDAYRFAAAIADEKGDLQFKWPMSVADSDARIDEDITFFDDMLTCVSEQFDIVPDCVSSAGVSAGALWTPVLASKRGDYLSSIIVLSGGTGGNLIHKWGGSPKKMPAMVLWGGETDNCFGIMNFQQTSQDLEGNLGTDGHFFLECIHNCGHAAPPFAKPENRTDFAPMWEFFLDHPYWVEDGQSPYEADGIPTSFPDWCGIGPGSATPRTGACDDPSGC